MDKIREMNDRLPFSFAAMAELADALDLGSSEATRTGSIPASRTSVTKTIPINEMGIYFLRKYQGIAQVFENNTHP